MWGGTAVKCKSLMGSINATVLYVRITLDPYVRKRIVTYIRVYVRFDALITAGKFGYDTHCAQHSLYTSATLVYVMFILNSLGTIRIYPLTLCAEYFEMCAVMEPRLRRRSRRYTIGSRICPFENLSEWLTYLR